SMVRAIRNISVARGYDPRDYALVTFGGAGAQHACAIARELGIRQVLSHPLSGLLSAYGMGLADVRRFREQAVLKPLVPELRADLQALFARLAAEAASEVRAEGIAAARVLAPRQQLDLRYKGVESSIAIECPLIANATTGREEPDPEFDYESAYHQRHQALYGYHHAGRAIEVLAARVEVVGQLPSPPEPARPLVERRPTPEEEVETWFEGRPLRTGVFTRAQLSPGDQIAGPAI
ncbi:MAG: hydantoinase/oxoprolinase family protein, partial [Planctomycetaceae bacterium]